VAERITAAPVTAALIAIDIFGATIRETRVVHPVAREAITAVARTRAISRIAGIVVADGSSRGACGGIFFRGTGVVTGGILPAPISRVTVGIVFAD